MTMHTINLILDDMMNVRFAYRPVMEIPFSYRALVNPEYHSPHRRWVEQTLRALQDVELPYLDALVPRRGFLPDFLTPTPLTSRVEIEDDLAEVLATPDSVIRQQVQWLIQDVGETEMRRFYLAHPREAVQSLVEDMRLYWRRALAHSWAGMQSVLEGDILYRGRQLALEGIESVLPDLHPSISYRPGAIYLAPAASAAHCPIKVSLQGGGIQLVPIVFNVAGRTWKVTPEWHPMIGYSPRGVGLYNHQPRPSRPLEVALGAGRARVLQGLRSPATTGDLARRLGLTSGAVSQQLERLKRAGLVEAHRNGKRVYYQLTRRGEELIALFERIN
jgi:DNA-binding transcriptional ArsR family regulator